MNLRTIFKLDVFIKFINVPKELELEPVTIIKLLPLISPNS